MEKSSAIRIIRQTFQKPFDKDSFVYFIQNLLNLHRDQIENKHPYSGNYIPNDFKKYISTLQRIAKYQDPEHKKIDILIVRLKKETSLERARTMQRNFIAWYLNGSRGDILKDAALVAFVSPNSEDWRFSLVKMDYRLDSSGEKIKVKQELTPARRFSFLVGKNESSHTAQSQLLPILQNDSRDPALQDLEEAFSVEGVTKEFFKKLSDWYAWAIDNVQFPKDAEKEKKDQQGRKIALIRFLTRIIFIWFMKQKKLSPDSQKSLIPDYLFDENELKDILKDFNPQGKESPYYKAILQNLFFATLSTRKEDRRLAKDSIWFGQKKVKSEMDVNNVYRYKELFKRQNEEYIKGLFNDIPFLNGGLFECLDKRRKDIYIDGFTRRGKEGYYQPIFPNFLFFSPERRNDEQINKSLNKYYGTQNKRYQVEGLINILKRYSFTIDENSPVDVDVALDPELLGRIFENLLASYNPETSTTARKATGSYYTPREIVNYMVDESLKAYFKTKLGDIKDIDQKLKELFSYEMDKHSFNEEETRKLVRAIDEIRVIDPAVGSGAFPMGILRRLVYLLSKLDPENKIWRELQRQKILKKIGESFKKEDRNQREKELKELNNVFERNTSNYGRKLYLIKNCIYGVDIQTIAIQIAKLRFFISLLVNMKVDKSKDNFSIKPLPNLETKFVTANSLIGLDNKGQLSFKDPQLKRLEDDLKKVRDLYFDTSDMGYKEKLRKRDRNIRKKIGKLLEEGGFAPESTKKIVSWDPYNPNKSAGWFDPEWMFGIKDGFDVVIGNPPYISYYSRQAKPLSKEALEFYKRNYNFILDKKKKGRFGTVMFFLERGIKICRKDGILTYIIDMNIFENPYLGIRKFLTDNFLIKEVVVNITGFEKVHSDQIILEIQKRKPVNNFVVCKDNNFKVITKIDQNELINNGYKWNLYDRDVIIEKLEQGSKLLNDLFPKRLIRTGITFTGKKKEFIANKQTQKKYKIKSQNIYDLYEGSKAFRFPYETPKPTEKINYDLELVKQLNRDYVKQNKSTKSPMVIGLGDLFVFKNPRILIRLSDVRITATYTEDVACSDLNLYSISNKNSYGDRSSYNLKFILALLNSKLITYYALKKKLIAMGKRKTPQIRLKSLKSLPIKLANNQESFIDLVDKIFDITKNPDYLENPAKQAEVREYEKQIDQLVYKLYNLTPEEIKIVENFNKQ